MIIAKDEGKIFHLTPAGNHGAVCFDVWDLGNQKTQFQGHEKVQYKIMIGFEIDERIESQDEWNGQRYRVYKKYTLSLNDKANLSKDLTSWRGKAFSDEEKKGFDVENLVGVNCMLNIIHAEYNGKTYANISAISSMPKGLNKIISENKRSIPEWIKKIQDSAVVNPHDTVENNDKDDDAIPF